MALITPTTHAAKQTHDEQILVVKRSVLFPDGAWQGLQEVDMQEYLHEVKMHQEFRPRALMEQDPTYKQIIPYLIFSHDNHYFLMERAKKASEQRLKSKLTLGIGGHIRKEDISGASIFDWARREFHEEINYSGNLSITPLGILNDDSNEVGQVHVGFVLLLKGDSPATKDECLKQKARMETWSQFVLEQL
jgi:predicted NUDIX family phosphoesterase